MKILVFGNSLVEKDSLALKILPRLKKEFPDIDFKELDPCENIEAEIENKKLRILDVVENAESVTLLRDIDKLRTDKVYSMHDFDLAYNLKLLKKIGKLEKVEIIGIPWNLGEEEAFQESAKIIENL